MRGGEGTLLFLEWRNSWPLVTLRDNPTSPLSPPPPTHHTLSQSTVSTSRFTRDLVLLLFRFGKVSSLRVGLGWTRASGCFREDAWEGCRHLSEKGRASPLVYTCKSAEAAARRPRPARGVDFGPAQLASLRPFALAAARAGPTRWPRALPASRPGISPRPAGRNVLRQPDLGASVCVGVRAWLKRGGKVILLFSDSGSS